MPSQFLLHAGGNTVFREEGGQGRNVNFGQMKGGLILGSCLLACLWLQVTGNSNKNGLRSKENTLLIGYNVKREGWYLLRLRNSTAQLLSGTQLLPSFLLCHLRLVS